MAEIDEINARLSQSVDTAEDLKNTIENVAKNNDVEVVKGTDTPKSVVEKMGQQLGNIDSISELNLTYGEESPTYDATDGMTVRATGQLKYGTDKTTTFDTEFNLPLVPADNSITIGVDEPNKKFTIKSVTTLVGEADPTTSTVGYIGQLYLNTTDNSTYQCTAISNGSYTWKLVNEDKFVKSMINSSGSSSTAVYVRSGRGGEPQEDKLVLATAYISQGTIMQRESGDPMCKIYTPRPTLNNKYIINIDYLQKYEQCRTGTSDPTSTTVAYYVGQLYLNTTNNALWICSAIGSETPKTYIWKLLGDGLDTQPRAISTQIYDNTTLASHIDEILGHVNTENSGSLVSISMKLTNAISGEMKSVTTNLSTNTLTNSTSTVNIINAGEAITLTLGAIRNGATSGKKATFICANDTNMCSFANIAISNINDTDTAILSGYEFTYGTNSIIHNFFNNISILNADLEHLVINYYAT